MRPPPLFCHNCKYNQIMMKSILSLFVFLFFSAISFAHEDELTHSWMPEKEPMGDEMLYGNFESQKWFVFTDAEATWRKREIDGVFRFEIKQNGKAAWIPLLYSSGHTFEEGKTYTFSIKAKADTPTALRTGIKRSTGNYGNLGFSDRMALTTEWKTFTFTIIPKETSRNAQISIGSFKAGITYDFTGATLRPGGNADLNTQDQTAVIPTRSP